MSLESGFHLSSRVRVCLIAAKEVTTAMFLNQFRSAIACQLTKTVVAINNGKISHLSVPQDKVSVRYTNCNMKGIWIKITARYCWEVKVCMNTYKRNACMFPNNELTRPVEFLDDCLNEDVLRGHKAFLHRHSDEKVKDIPYKPTCTAAPEANVILHMYWLSKYSLLIGCRQILCKH